MSGKTKANVSWVKINKHRLNINDPSLVELLKKVKPWVEDLSRSTPLFYANGDKYATLWSDVDQVFFPINKTSQHWCLSHFDILSGLITFYDSGDTYDYESRDLYVRVQECLQRQEQMIEMQPFLHLSTVLAESYNLLKEVQDYELKKCRDLMKSISETQLKVLKKSFLAKERLPGILGATKVFEKKGIDPTDYSIRFKLADPVPKQGDPIDVAMAYREKIVRFYFSHKIDTF
ncbi:phospholipase-like protein [Tanacetum coccineum]